ncbi:MAG: hypothetical protein R2828_26100 [Saprospiraceae bacterium]
MAYISFALTLLFFFGITLINGYFSKPHRGEDGIALGMMLQVVVIGFTICSLILTISIWWKGDFDWVSPQGRTRNLLVGFGWLCMVVAIFDSSFFASGWYHGFPDFFRLLVKRIGQIWMPLFMFFSCFFLLNTELKARVSPHFYKTPMAIAFGLAALMVLGILFGWVRKQIEHKVAVREARQEEIRKYGGDRSWYFKTSMDFINAHNDTTITRLLSFTILNRDRDKGENDEIRKAAVAKIKSYEYWETDLIRILERKEIGDIFNAYGFLEVNTLEHPEKFIIPIKNSITYVTAVTQASIKNPDNFFLGSTNIAVLCHILEAQFKGRAAEFRPNMVRLQQVLDITPAKRSDKKYAQDFNEILQKYRLDVKNWLETN